MRRQFLILSLWAIAVLLPAPEVAAQGRVITLDQLARSLPQEPINVVFDVDDTALFTSPGFQWGTRTYGPRIVSAGVPVREQDMATEEDRRSYREFWTRMNNELDEYSVKKWIAGRTGFPAPGPRRQDLFCHQADLHGPRTAHRHPAPRVQPALRLTRRDLHQSRVKGSGLSQVEGTGQLRRLRWRHSRVD